MFNTELDETLTLRSNLLSQKEEQLLMQMVQSPVIYLVKTYDSGGGSYPYGIPYICVNDDFIYNQKVNEKEIFAEISLKPANQRIIQKN